MKKVIIMALCTLAISNAANAQQSGSRQVPFVNREAKEIKSHNGNPWDNSTFVSWATQVETGQSARVDHAFVDYQIPANAHHTPLVYVHGYGGSGVCWEMTPDGRDGFSTLMLRRNWSSYVMDLPGRGRAGRTSATTEVKPLPTS